MTKSDFSMLLNDPKVIQLFSLFSDHGHELRFIGGCVRDILLGCLPGDRDLATTATPDVVLAILNDAGIHVVATGLQHGTVTAIIDKTPYEITTLRRDSVTDGRHADVVYTHDWKEDARRRDFTMNALSVDQKGILYDYTDGQNDLNNKRLRFIGNPHDRIREDYLRILRYFRFASVLNWPLDAIIVRACADNKEHLKILSRERIQAELLKLLMGPGVVRIIESLVSDKILQPLLSVKTSLSSFVTLIALEEKYHCQDGWRRLMALIGCNPIVMEHITAPSRQQRKRLNLIHKDVASQSVFEQLYRDGAQAVLDRALLNHSINNDLVTMVTTWQRPDFPVKASDFPDLSGAALGRVLKNLEDAWLEHKGMLNKADLMGIALNNGYYKGA